jgi:hypothetical protein
MHFKPRTPNRFFASPSEEQYYSNDPDMMKLIEEGATIKAYYEQVLEEGVK